MKSRLSSIGEKVYESNKEFLERNHMGKIVALCEKGVAGIGDTLEEVYKKAREKLSEGSILCQKGWILPSSNLHVSPIAYKDNNPIVSIRVKSVTEVELEAYVDSGAGVTLIPRSVARKIGLEYFAETPIITGKGKSTLELYRAIINLLGKILNS